MKEFASYCQENDITQWKELLNVPEHIGVMMRNYSFRSKIYSYLFKLRAKKIQVEKKNPRAFAHLKEQLQMADFNTKCIIFMEWFLDSIPDLKMETALEVECNEAFLAD